VLQAIERLTALNQPADKISWPSPPARLNLAGNEVHVWAALLNVAPAALKKFGATLSKSEKDRAAKFRFDKHRNRFIAGRGLMRTALGRYLQIHPGKLDFVSSKRGKPQLSSEFAGADLHFNLAHSEELGLLAITRIGALGVDIERVRRITDVDDLVVRFFSKRESALFQKLALPEKPTAFFNLWTRKEALLKATGQGIGMALNAVEVSFLPGDPARLLAIAGDAHVASGWSLQELAPAAGYVGATAVQAPIVRLQCWKWD
jgi:4'-phosphopantetheinyl transferase